MGEEKNSRRCEQVKVGITVGLICLFFGLVATQGVELQISTYKLEEPEKGHYKLIMEVYLPETESSRSFTVFRSNYLMTNVLKAQAISESGDEIKTEIIIDDKGYLNVLVGPTSKKPQAIKVTIDVIDPESFQMEDNIFSFDTEVEGEQLITVILPSGYGLLESTGIPQLGDEGRVHVEFYSASKAKFPVHVVAAKLK